MLSATIQLVSVQKPDGTVEIRAHRVNSTTKRRVKWALAADRLAGATVLTDRTLTVSVPDPID